MPLHVALTHRTSYHYDRLVTLGPQTIRLRPAPHARTPIVSYALKVEPQPHFLNWQQDPQGNYLARIVFPERVARFEVTVDLVADMVTVNPFDFFLEPQAEQWPFAYDHVLDQELAPFRRLDPPGPLLAAFLAKIPRHPQRTVDMLVALNRMVQQRIAYIVRLEPGVWTPEQTLGNATGSCRDSAWLLVQALRQLGFAARFVSGYLIQLVADVKPLNGPEGPTADFTDLHAWAEVYLPGAGWIGLDATSGLMAGEGHIPLAASPDPVSAAAISGVVEPCETKFDFAMAVTRIRETPRTTRPYTPAQWQDILATGVRVDRALAEGDMRLTMGGEPTFVSATDIDADEWNTDALGPTKRRYAGHLLRRLAARSGRPARRSSTPSASTTRASSCPAGRCTPTGGRTASRCGAIPTCSPGRTTTPVPPPPPTPPASAPHWPNGCRSIRRWCSRPMRTSTTICGASTGCPPTSSPRTLA